jgi:hypothetical protein
MIEYSNRIKVRSSAKKRKESGDKQIREGIEQNADIGQWKKLSDTFITELNFSVLLHKDLN